MPNGKAPDPGLLESCRQLAAAFRIDDGAGFRIRDHDPAATGPLRKADKPEATARLATCVEAIAALQDRLYAEDRWSLLVVLQAMDAAGKDGVIKHVFSGVNPQGCHVTPFKAPSAEELDHDFLWRCNRALPERGRIGVFNRSYYEEVLVVKVHRRSSRRSACPRIGSARSCGTIARSATRSASWTTTARSSARCS